MYIGAEAPLATSEAKWFSALTMFWHRALLFWMLVNDMNGLCFLQSQWCELPFCNSFENCSRTLRSQCLRSWLWCCSHRVPMGCNPPCMPAMRCLWTVTKPSSIQWAIFLTSRLQQINQIVLGRVVDSIIIHTSRDCASNHCDVVWLSSS
jgi:hypothetical protein